MKKSLFLVILFLLLPLLNQAFLFGQGTGPCDVDPICSSTSYNFPNATGKPDVRTQFPGANFGCLGYSPNAAWYYMQVDQSGPINLTVKQGTSPGGGGTGLDVDFALWGPFNNLGAACTGINNGNHPIQASYNDTPTETISIGSTGGSMGYCAGSTSVGRTTPPSAVAGQIYVVVVTNYADAPGYISLQQTNAGASGAGSMNCAIVQPDPCNISAITASAACTGGNANITGSITFTDAPTTGSLIVSNTCGTGTQTFPASSFSTGSATLNYNISAGGGHGQSCDVTAYFTAEASCARTSTITLPNCCTTARPTVSITAPTCLANGSATISNYSVFTSPTFTFSPAGPTVGAGGVISGMTPGQNYTVTATVGGCSSLPSTSFKIAAKKPIPVKPVITVAPPTCSAAGSATLTNLSSYTGATTPNFSPAGPSGNATTGAITGVTLGTTYTISMTLDGCTSPTTSFTVLAQKPTPARPTISTTAATCSAAGSSTITNYTGTSSNYTFSPAGPTVGAGGVISGMTPGTAYTVTATVSGCPSTPSVSFTNAAMLPTPARPTINTTAASCSAAGSSSITNYNSGYTYTFTPAGPTVGAGGTISGMTPGTSYTVIATTGGCDSPISASFSNTAQLPAPATPTVTSTPATCSAAGSSTMTNYNAANTYTFTPAGPTVGAGGAISGMTVGTSYTVIATSGGCDSPISATFTNAAQIPAPDMPTVNTTAASCSAAGSSTVTNYNSGYTYTFTPTGPTVGTGGTISGMTAGTSYTVVATSGGCDSPISASFTVADMIPTPTAPVVATTAASCTAAGTASIGAGYTGNPGDYTFTPTGPTIGAGGIINGAAVGTPYSVIVTTGGCPSTGTSFTVAAQNAAPTIVASTDIAICSGSSTTLTATGGVTYSWDNGLGSGASHVVSPTVATTYNVTGTDGNGCTNTDQVTVSVNPLPTATISGTADVCQNGTAPMVTFTGANGTQPYTFTYTVNGGSNQTVVSTGATATVPASTTANGTFTYTLVSVQDASSTTCSNPQTGTVTVVVKPKPVVVLATSNTTICSGNGVTITPSSTPTGASFNWTVQNVNTSGASNGSGTVIADNLTTTGTTAGTTTYTVTGTLNGCASDPVNAVITVNPSPIVTAQNQTICSGATTSIALNSNIPSTSISWTTVASGVAGASNGTGNQINQTLTSLTGGTVTYTVTPTLGTCTGTPLDVVVTVSPTPTVVATPTNSDVCAGASVTLSGSGALTYTWSPASGLSSTTGASVIATPTATTTYTVTGTNANGCTGTSQATVIVRPYPSLTMSPDTTICLGETISLNVNGAGTYTWTPATGLDQTTGATVLASPTTATTYVVSGTSNGCTTTDSIKIAVNPLPIVNAGADQTICRGTPVILTATGTLNYVWSDGIMNGVPFVADSTRTYTVTGIDANGCKNVDHVKINTLAAPVIDFTADTTSGCSPLHVQFTNNTVGGVTYLWEFGDGQISTAKNAYNDYIIDGCHDVTLTVDNGQGCSVSMTMDDYICVQPSPTAAFNASTYDITNVMNEVFFNNQSQDAITYEWSFDDGIFTSTVKHPKHTYEPSIIRNHNVILVAMNDEGCTDTARAVIKMKEDVVFFVPNTFTPDGDQFNNIFTPVFVEGFDGYEYEMLIFNRWGEIIFETRDLEYGWDGTYKLSGGKMCQDGVYVWKITIKKKGVDERITKSGHVTLIR